jgi:hypothetical protein
VTVRVLDGRAGVALVVRYAHAGEKFVPGDQRVGVQGQSDSGRAGVDVTQDIVPNDDSACGLWSSKVTWTCRLIRLLRSEVNGFGWSRPPKPQIDWSLRSRSAM